MLYSIHKSDANRDSLFFISILILCSICYISPLLFNENSTNSLLLLFTISALLIIYFFKIQRILEINFSELVYLLFIVYVIIKSTFTNTFYIGHVGYFCFFVCLYYGLKQLFTITNPGEYVDTLIISTSTVLLAYLVFAIYHCWIQNETITTFFFPNKSVFGILLASQIAFALPGYFLYKKQKKIANLPGGLLVGLITAATLLLVFTGSRAGYIGMALALAYTAYKYLTAAKHKQIVLFLFLIFSALLSVAMLFYKSESTGGRLLIYKVAAGMLKGDWLWGIGQGQFKIQYNLYQAAYFTSHNINSSEALLADNSYYAFNDFLQVFIENGLIGFLLLTGIIMLVIKQIKITKTNSENRYLLIASAASLVCILTGSLVSYPLQIFPIAVQATFCLAIINSFRNEKKSQIELSETGGKIAKIILVLLSSFLFVHYILYFNYKGEVNKAFELKRSGFRQSAIEKYRSMRDSYLQEGNMLFLYAQELYYTNQLTLARETLKKAKKYYCSNEVYKLSATIEKELKNYEQAEIDYKTAIYMVPNRMVSRNELFKYFVYRKDTINAVYWGHSILNMPVKIPSHKIDDIRQKTKQILAGLMK